MRVGYADPPYVGCAHLYDGGAEVNHEALIGHLCDDFDAWALSASSPSLRTILPMCPDDVRVMAWVKPFAVFKPNVGVAYAWEPIIVRGGRKIGRDQPTVRDWVRCNITLRRGLVGAKPDGFCFWLFQVLNMQHDDDFVDLFPGTGGVMRCWEKFKRQIDLFSKEPL